MAIERRVVTVVNMTGHPLRLGTETNNLRFRSESKGIKLDTHYRVDERVMVESEDGIVTVPILSLTPGRAAPVPDPQENVIYVVSGLVASRVRRPDILSPARQFKDDNGRVRFASALLRYE